MAKYNVLINSKWCKSCGICAAFCPKQVLRINEDKVLEVAAPEACIGCRFCEYRCPDMAITVSKEANNG